MPSGGVLASQRRDRQEREEKCKAEPSACVEPIATTGRAERLDTSYVLTGIIAGSVAITLLFIIGAIFLQRRYRFFSADQDRS